MWSPESLEQWLAYPKVDALVTGVAKHTTSPVEGGAALKDPQDQNGESTEDGFLLIVSGTPSDGVQWFDARALLCWIQRLLKDLFLRCLESATAFLADTTYDLLSFQLIQWQWLQ